MLFEMNSTCILSYHLNKLNYNSSNNNCSSHLRFGESSVIIFVCVLGEFKKLATSNNNF